MGFRVVPRLISPISSSHLAHISLDMASNRDTLLEKSVFRDKIVDCACYHIHSECFRNRSIVPLKQIEYRVYGVLS